MIARFLLATLMLTAPTDYDPSDAAAIKQQIDEKHRERFKRYFADSCFAYLNFSDRACLSCQKEEEGRELEERLRQAGFWRRETVSQSAGHCLGITLLFIEYLLAHRPKLGDSCEEILGKFLNNTPHFQERAHHFQVNQPGYYTDSMTGKWVPIDCTSARTCFEVLVGSRAEEYQYIPKELRNQAKFDCVTFYRALKKLEGQLILVGVSDEKANHPHCFAVYAWPEKVLVFDANEGLFEFVDFETLSYLHEQFLVKKRLTFMVSFSLEKRT